jgi:hypothetical protein
VLDARAVAIGALVLAAAIAVIWAPGTGHGLLLPRGIRRGGRALLGALVFLAVVPHVLPYDHMLTEAHPDHAEAHAAHCHGAAADCADAPIPAGPGQFLSSTPLLLAPALFAVLMLISSARLTGLTRRPELRPPLLKTSI